MGKAIAFATPVFFLLIALEVLRGARARPGRRLPAQRRDQQPEPRRDEPGGRALHAGVRLSASTRSSSSTSRSAAAGRTQWWAWAAGHRLLRLLLLLESPRSATRARVFWAAHVVHHQSQDYNLSTALRQTSSGAFLGWIFYLPMAVAGVPPQVFAVAAIVDLLYQYWIHTEAGRQARLVRPLVRVAIEPPRAPRRQRPLHRPQLRRHLHGAGTACSARSSRRPSAACTARARRSTRGIRCGPTSRCTRTSRASRWQCERWSDSVRVWLKPPGWRPAGSRWHDLAEAAFRRVAGADATTRRCRAPCARLPSCRSPLAILGSMLLLWYAEALSGLPLVAGAVAVIAMLWLTGAVMQSRLRLSRAVAVELAVAGIALVATGASAARAAAAPSTIAPVIVDDARVQRRRRACAHGFPRRSNRSIACT